MAIQTQARDNMLLRWSVIGAVALVALFGSYRFAVARTGTAQAAVNAPAPAADASGAAVIPADTGDAASAGSACACCGTGAPAGPAVTKQADVIDGVQRITVDLSKGYYDPSVIELKAGVPAEITFGQSGGCTAQVQSQDLGFYEDLQAGPVTVKLAALEPGSYGFTCGMNMVSGTVVVK